MSWLLEHLIRAGHITETGVTRKARIRTCPRCRADTIVGLDAVTTALEVRVDPQPLSVVGEALALLEGRYTVAVHREASRYVLDDRNHYNVASRPAGTADREDVLRQHRCGDAPAGALVAASSFEPVTTATSDVPPF